MTGIYVPDLPLTGYTDRLSARPGETVAFRVSSRLAGPYRAELVRVICGDPNPAGPGLIERPVSSAIEGTYPSRTQAIRAGSFAVVDGLAPLGQLSALALDVVAWPTAPGEDAQGILTLGTGEGALCLGLDEAGRPTLWAGEPVCALTTPLRRRRWVRLTAEIDLAAGRARLTAERIGDRFAVAETATAEGLALPAAVSPRSLHVAVREPEANAGHFDGKLEAPTLRAGTGPDAPVALALDFARGIPTQEVEDTGPHGLHGRLVNLPTRGVTGARWTGAEHCWRHAPDHYAAIHFHRDDIADCGWQTDFALTIPEDLPSGLYAAKLSGEGATDRIPFVVLPPPGRRTADLCVVVPTFTYLMYANHVRVDFTPALEARAAEWGAFPHFPARHRGLGLSTYDRHTDGSGIAFATALRPMLTLRPDYLSILDARGSGLRHLPADTHLLAWLDAQGIACDLVTDHELHAEGAAALAGYRAVLTATHPEYHSIESLDAVEGYRDAGGRLAYLGGNGFYWRVAMQAEPPHALEIRRAEGGIRAWDAQPGEYWHAVDGTYGGLWRRNARPPQRLTGVGFAAQGLFEGATYRLEPHARETHGWLFDGVAGEVFGDHGLSGGGAAGYELDRTEEGLGTPEGVAVLARSFGHQAHFVAVPEELLTHVTTVSGEPVERLIEAHMTYWETPAGGAVFATGSITFCGSLLTGGGANDISRLMANLLARWLAPSGDR